MIDGSDEGGFSSVRVEEGGEDGLVDGDFAFEHGVAVKCVSKEIPIHKHFNSKMEYVP